MLRKNTCVSLVSVPTLFISHPLKMCINWKKNQNLHPFETLNIFEFMFNWITNFVADDSRIQISTSPVFFSLSSFPSTTSCFSPPHPSPPSPPFWYFSSSSFSSTRSSTLHCWSFPLVLFPPVSPVCSTSSHSCLLSCAVITTHSFNLLLLQSSEVEVLGDFCLKLSSQLLNSGGTKFVFAVYFKYSPFHRLSWMNLAVPHCLMGGDALQML